MKTLLVILTTSECKQNAVSALGASERSARAVTTRGTQWKRRESASNRQLERCRNAMELRKIAAETPWKPCDIAILGIKINFHAISRRSGKFNKSVQLQ